MQNPQPPPPVKSWLTTDAQPETLDSSGRGPSGPFDKEAGGRDELATNGFSWMERRLPPPFQPCRERGRVIAAGSRSPRLHRGPTALLRARSRATLKRRRNGNEDALSSEGPKAGRAGASGRKFSSHSGREVGQSGSSGRPSASPAGINGCSAGTRARMPVNRRGGTEHSTVEKRQAPRNPRAGSSARLQRLARGPHSRRFPRIRGTAIAH